MMAKQISNQQYMLMSMHKTELQKIIDYQLQQIKMLQKRIQQISSQNIRLANENDELKVKCVEYQTIQGKVCIIKDALMRDFHKLKQKMQQQCWINQKLEQQLAGVQQLLVVRQKQICNLHENNQNASKTLSKVEQNIQIYKQQNQNLRNKILEMKLMSIDDRFASVVQSDKQNKAYVGVNNLSKSTKKKRNILINNTQFVSRFVTSF